MDTKLKKINTQYRTFVDNQVLTSAQLNEFIKYFEDQDRLSNVFLNGVGLGCGFNVVLELNNDISISQGVGVTTDGDIFKLLKGTHPSEKKIDFHIQKYTHYKVFEDEFAIYPFFRKTVGGSEVTIELLELLPQQGENSYALSSLSDISDKVVLLYLESFEKKGDLCNSIDCDNQGTQQVARLKVLLVSEEDAEYIAGQDPIFTWHNIVEKYKDLPELKVPRVDLTTAYDLGSIKLCYVKAISLSTLHKMKDGFKTIFNIFGKTLISGKIDEIFEFVKPEITVPEDFQYRYDLFADLIDTYNEIKEILLHINAECNPDIDAFPKHLLLGKLVETNDYKTLRHQFYRVPLSKCENSNRKKVLSLISRVSQLVNKYNTGQKNKEIRITPSQKSGILGYKSLPFYYKVDESFLDFWCFQKTQNLKQKFNLSYHIEMLDQDDEIQKPLLYNIDNYDFLNIEGLLTDALESKDKINSIKNQFGLNFDCIILELQSNVVSVQEFFKKHITINHRYGVTKDGTFIIVAEKDKTVAEFYIPYKIAPECERDSCCYLTECTYPWISSLKYLNNLARSIKGTQSRNKAMPQNYVLQVVEYKINGSSLINNTSTLYIPLKNIFLRRMHAVTEALNNRFNNGLIFDFNESQKRFVIIRAKEDTYTIRFRDVTMANNNPIYTYSNNGMFRNNKVFRPDAMRCRCLKKYNPSYYEKLHKKLAPVNKDDDNGSFCEKWSQWNYLKEMLINNAYIKEHGLTRMITSVSQLPGDIQTQLTNLKTDFRAVGGKKMQFKLDGDWVTGEWVDNKMLDYYRIKKNRKNTHDDIVAFINLRQLLHSETGVTKLSVYVTNHMYDATFDNVISKYDKFADIYFGQPGGANAIIV